MPEVASTHIVLFLCTGNYYRSRYAEYLFNVLAKDRKLNWIADSRGLNCAYGATVNVGPISRYTIDALTKKNIACPPPHRMPEQVSDADLEQADLTIALKEAEHRKLMEQLHPAWANQITYWHVHDLDAATPEQALPEIDGLVHQLIDKLCVQR